MNVKQEIEGDESRDSKSRKFGSIIFSTGEQNTIHSFLRFFAISIIMNH